MDFVFCELNRGPECTLPNGMLVASYDMYLLWTILNRSCAHRQAYVDVTQDAQASANDHAAFTSLHTVPYLCVNLSHPPAIYRRFAKDHLSWRHVLHAQKSWLPTWTERCDCHLVAQTPRISCAKFYERLAWCYDRRSPDITSAPDRRWACLADLSKQHGVQESALLNTRHREINTGGL